MSQFLYVSWSLHEGVKPKKLILFYLFSNINGNLVCNKRFSCFFLDVQSKNKVTHTFFLKNEVIIIFSSFRTIILYFFHYHIRNYCQKWWINCHTDFLLVNRLIKHEITICIYIRMSVSTYLYMCALEGNWQIYSVHTTDTFGTCMYPPCFCIYRISSANMRANIPNWSTPATAGAFQYTVSSGIGGTSRDAAVIPKKHSGIHHRVFRQIRLRTSRDSASSATDSGVTMHASSEAIS